MRDDWICNCGGKIIVNGGVSYCDGHIGGNGYCEKCGVSRYVMSFPPGTHDEIMKIISEKGI